MKWESRVQDLVVLSFALEAEEIRRILPSELDLQTRRSNSTEYSFFNLGLCRIKNLHSPTLNVYSLDFPMAYLSMCVNHRRLGSSYFVKKVYSQGFEAFLMRWGVGLPTQSMKLTYPSRAHPGGEYFWDVRGSGVGKFRGRIQNEHGTSGRIFEFFDSDEEMREFLLGRNHLLFGHGSGRVKCMELSFPEFDPHVISFGEMELGFLASDLERHTFPECVVGGSFVPELPISLEGTRTIDL